MQTEVNEKLTYVKASVQLTIKFRIEKFDQLMKSTKPGEELHTERVSCKLAPLAVWRLGGTIVTGTGDIWVVPYFAGPKEYNNEEYIKLATGLEASCKLSLGSEASRGMIEATLSSYQNVAKESSRRALYGWSSIISHDKVKEALEADGSLMLFADINFTVPEDNVKKMQEESELTIKWKNSISQLHPSGAFSDCTLMVGGEELKAHRNILSAISPYFKGMFSTEACFEARDGIVRIEKPGDTSQECFAKPYKALLAFAYSGNVDWSVYGDCKQDVLALADEWLVNDLKEHVERLLVDEITTDNCAELALLADSCSCDALKKVKKACVEYLSSNCKAVVATPGWGTLMRERVALAEEMFQLMSLSSSTSDTVGMSTTK